MQLIASFQPRDRYQVSAQPFCLANGDNFDTFYGGNQNSWLLAEHCCQPNQRRNFMSVANILGEKGRNVVTIQGGVSLLDVARSLSTNKIGAVIVSDDGVSVDGIVSERDIVNAIAKNGAEVLLRSVSKFMTQNVITCQDSETIENLMEKMTKGRFRHLPVVNDGKLDGVISIGDVVKMRIAEAQSEADAMRDYIATG